MVPKPVRRVLVFVAVGSFLALAVLGDAPTVRAITWGEPDAGHLYVGTLVMGIRPPPDSPNPSPYWYWQWCSGSLLSPTVLLSAGHCVEELPAWVPLHYEAGITALWVTFAPVLQTAKLTEFYPVAEFKSHPDYDWGPMSDPHDVGVFVLGEPASSVTTFGTLARPGYLDGLRDSGTIGWVKDPVFVNVGYGMMENKGLAGTRKVSYSGFISLHKAWLYTSGNIHVGSGGTCYGDSGGPAIYPEGVVEYIVGVNSWGDTPCKATSMNYRVDTESSLAFIRGFLSIGE